LLSDDLVLERIVEDVYQRLKSGIEGWRERSRLKEETGDERRGGEEEKEEGGGGELGLFSGMASSFLLLPVSPEHPKGSFYIGIRSKPDLLREDLLPNIALGKGERNATHPSAYSRL